MGVSKYTKDNWTVQLIVPLQVSPFTRRGRKSSTPKDYTKAEGKECAIWDALGYPCTEQAYNDTISILLSRLAGCEGIIRSLMRLYYLMIYGVVFWDDGLGIISNGME